MPICAFPGQGKLQAGDVIKKMFFFLRRRESHQSNENRFGTKFNLTRCRRPLWEKVGLWEECGAAINL